MSDFIVGNWGNLASVFGLLFSILAFVFAKRASTAAREARDAAMRQSLGEDMNGAARTADEIAMYLRFERGDVALVRISDLMNRARYLVERWDTRLSEKSKNNLLDASEELRSMHGVLTKNANAGLAERQKVRLAEAAQRVSAIFSEEHGTAASRHLEIRDK
jgi:hypothetical protein